MSDEQIMVAIIEGIKRGHAHPMIETKVESRRFAQIVHDMQHKHGYIKGAIFVTELGNATNTNLGIAEVTEIGEEFLRSSVETDA